jgi:hypothetical protein
MSKTQRIRDPVHDLIVFDEQESLDLIAWNLLETPEFQRLRRIKQLGVSEFVFPGATHTRFAHSVGVFHNARRLLGLIQRELKSGRVQGKFEEDRAKVAVLAALVHDIGHGPFSHAFEGARKSIAERRAKEKNKAKIKKHEGWTADIIENRNGHVWPILEKSIGAKDARAVADLLRADTPADMYHAIVSSSFDADRLDYIQRDRYMTGTGVGAIDLRWLLDNVRVANIDVSPPSGDAGEPVYTHSFCLAQKGREAAEDFLLARYRLYSTVYLHKTTRGVEQMLSALFSGIAIAAEEGKASEMGFGDNNPLVSFLTMDEGNLSDYLKLDDGVVWGSIERIARSTFPGLSAIARRILEREKPFALDVQQTFPDNAERQRRAQHKLDEMFKDRLGVDVFKDEAKLTLYGEIGADDEKAQKRLMIQIRGDDLKEITDFKDSTIVPSSRERRFLRYYFLDESAGKDALAKMQGGQ